MQVFIFALVQYRPLVFSGFVIIARAYLSYQYTSTRSFGGLDGLVFVCLLCERRCSKRANDHTLELIPFTDVILIGNRGK